MAQLRTKETVRLERGEASAKVFWEVARTRLEVATRFGRHLSAGRTVTKRYESMKEASAAFDRAVADKRREGYSEPAPRAKAGVMSRKGVSARDAALESAIDEAPDDADRYLVYADWLQQQGDPRGELIVIQHRLAQADDMHELSALERDEATLFQDYEQELLGPLAPLVTYRSSIRSYRAFSWRHGFIRTVRMRRWTAQNLTDLFVHPSGRFLERIALPLGFGDEAMINVLRMHAPKSLCVVFVDGSYLGEATALAQLWGALPRMRILTLSGPVGERLGAPEGNSLEKLRVRWGNRATLAAVTNVSWPKLARLHVTLLDDRCEDLLNEILDAKRTPALAHFSLRNWFVDASERRELIAKDDLALLLVRLGAVRRLAQLDLELPISTSGARTLLSKAADQLRAIGTVVMSPKLIDSDVRKALVDAHPAIRWAPEPEEEALELTAIDATPLQPSG